MPTKECDWKDLIEKRLDQLIAENPSLPYAHLFSAARYSLLSSAKRIRPLLLFATLETFGVPVEIGVDPACAIEMVHTYSLIHDDLPCMDNDDYRRGKPTLHKVFPESHALLTGDFLLTHAFEILCRTSDLTDGQKVALVQTLSKHAGSHGMIGGQVIDLFSENKRIDWPTLELMHYCKTACLIIASLDCGAIIANASAVDRSILQSVGKKMGIAFQIVDDLLDVTGSFSEMGKLTGSDEYKKKATAVSVLGIQACKEKAEELYTKAEKELSTLSRPAPFLSSLFQLLIRRSK
ncbi:MAG: polyprenyl synthetase family protein [Verrucomicrobia bacterium]|nr:polyprenyl synthetase family protein [Verrucomicrobiota bacterium]